MIKIENFEVVGWEHAFRGMRNPKNSWAKSDSTFHETAWTSEFNPNGQGSIENLAVRFDALALGEKDHKLAMNLRKAGTDHRKYMRYIDVFVDITAPLYFWKEFKTYRHGRKFMDDENLFDYDDELLEMHIETNSCSTMHTIHEKEFVQGDFSCEHLTEDSIAVIPNDSHGNDIWSSLDVLNVTIIALNELRREFIETNNKSVWDQMIQLLPSSYNQKRTVKLNYECLARMYKSRKHHKLDEWREFCSWIESLPYSEIITGNVEEKQDD